LEVGVTFLSLRAGRSNPEIFNEYQWIAEPVPNVVKDRGLLAMTEEFWYPYGVELI